MSKSEALQKAKADTAQVVGMRSGAYGLAVGAVSGPMSSWMERPFQRIGAAQAIANAAGETFGEALEGGVESLGSNITQRDVLDPNKDILEGVGTEIAQNIIGSAGMSGIGLAAGARPSAVRKAEGLSEKIDALRTASTAPTSASTAQTEQTPSEVQQSAVQASASAPEVDANGIPVPPTEVPTTAEPPAEVSPEQETLAKARNNVFALRDSMEEFKTSLPEGTSDANAWINYFRGLKNTSDNLENFTKALKETSEEDLLSDETTNEINKLNAVAKVVTSAIDFLSNTDLTDIEGKEAEDLRAIKKQMLDSISASGFSPTKFRDESAKLSKAAIERIQSLELTPEVTRARQQLGILLAMTDPASLDAGTVQSVVSSPEVMSSLDASSREIFQLADRVYKKAEENFNKQQWPANTGFSKVYGNIIFDKQESGNEPKISSYKYLMNIAEALKAGKRKEAAKYLNRFKLFRQHMNNKAAAIEESKKTGKPVQYDALSKFKDNFYKGSLVYKNTEGGNFYYSQIKFEADSVNSIYQDAENLFNGKPLDAKPETTPTAQPIKVVEPTETKQSKPKKEAKQEVKKAEPKESTKPKKSKARVKNKAFVNSVGSKTVLNPSYEQPITYKGLSYKSVEAAYLAQKYDPSLRDRFTKLNTQQARKLDKKLSKIKRKSDDAYSKYADQSFEFRAEAVLADIYRTLFRQNPEAEALYKKSTISNLKVEDSPLLDHTSVTDSASEVLIGLKKNRIKVTPTQDAKNVVLNIENISFLTEEEKKEVNDLLGEDNKEEPSQKGIPVIADSLENLASSQLKNNFRLVDVDTTAASEDAIQDVADSAKNGTLKEKLYASTIVENAEDLNEAFQSAIYDVVAHNKKIDKERAATKKIVGKKIVSGALLLLDAGEEVNNALASRAVLGALNWFYSIGIRKGSYAEEQEDVASKLGRPLDALSYDLIKAYSSGIKLDCAVDQVGQNIMDYLGLRPKKDTNYAGGEGIFNDIGKNLIALMIQKGMLKIETVNVSFGNSHRTFNFVVPTSTETNVESMAVSQYLNTVMNKQDSMRMYLGDDIPSIDTRVSHRSDDLTQEQRDLLKIANSQPHYFNDTIYNFFVNTLGLKNLKDLFGAAIPAETDWNAALYDSLNSRNRVIEDSIKILEQNREAMEAYAKEHKIPLSEVKKYYAFSITAVGRLQEKEPYGPVASKLTREVISPIRKKVDLFDPKIKNEYRRSLAQAFDIKVNKVLPNLVEQKLNKIEEVFEKNGLFDHMIGVIYEHKPIDIALIKKSFNEANIHTSPTAFTTPLAIHALYDWTVARAVEEQAGLKGYKKAEINTTLYTELDGITNGNFFLQVLNPIGVNKAWLKALARAGFFIGHRRTASEGYADPEWTDGKDNYYVFGTFSGWNSVKNLFRGKSRDLADFYNLIANDIYNDSSELARNVVKKPITAIGYYSGVNGISNKFIGLIANHYKGG